MLMAHPAVLSKLIERYESLRALHAASGTQEARRRLDDVVYTLCVSTGTRDIDSALTAAQRRLSAVRPEDDSLVPA